MFNTQNAYLGMETHDIHITYLTTKIMSELTEVWTN
jgi:hypothetical protein